MHGREINKTNCAARHLYITETCIKYRRKLRFELLKEVVIKKPMVIRRMGL